MPQTIPLTAIAQYSSLQASIAPNGSHRDDAQLRSLSTFDSEHRATLTDAVLTDMREWGAPLSAMTAAEELRSPDAYAVVTGQRESVLDEVVEVFAHASVRAINGGGVDAFGFVRGAALEHGREL